MKVAKTNYSKTDVLRMFKAWAKADSTWKHHVDKLAGIECVGDLPNVDPEFPAKILHPALGTSLDKRDLRHAMRDICRAVAVSESVSNDAMTAAWDERVKCEKFYLDFCNARLGSGDYYDQKAKIEHVRDAQTRERRMAVLESEKRRRASVCDEAARKFSRLEDDRSPYDDAARDFPQAFPGHQVWARPNTPPSIDSRNPVLAKIDEIDWDEIVFSDERVFFVESLAATIVGHVENGPLFFTNKEAAEQFIEDNPKFALASTRLASESVRSRLQWYAERHTFIRELPTAGQWLFVTYPALLVAAPPAPEEYETKLAAIREPAKSEW